jgi:PilZ domain
VTDEQRAHKRIAVNLPARWDGLSGGLGARIEDLSLGGCFVNAHGVVNVGELITLEIQLPSGVWLTLRGEVTHYQPAIGFGLVFSFLTEEEEYELRQVLAL